MNWILNYNSIVIDQFRYLEVIKNEKNPNCHRTYVGNGKRLEIWIEPGLLIGKQWQKIRIMILFLIKENMKWWHQSTLIVALFAFWITRMMIIIVNTWFKKILQTQNTASLFEKKVDLPNSKRQQTLVSVCFLWIYSKL